MNKEDLLLMYDKYPMIYSTHPGPDELWWLVEKVLKIKPEVIVEVGVMAGGGMKIWEQCLPPNGIYIGIDNRHDLFSNIFWEWKKSDRKLHLIQNDSTDEKTAVKVKNILNEKFIDFLFIDGNHENGTPEKDFNNFYPMVRNGGIIGFDDINIIDGNYPVPRAEKYGTCGTLFQNINYRKEFTTTKGIIYKES